MSGPVAIADAASRHHAVRRLTIASGGGTGGHVFPALALIEAFQIAHPAVAVTFVGSADGPEARIAAAHGLAFASVAAAPYYGVGMLGRLRTLDRLVAGVTDARRLLRATRSELVVGLGGFASAGAIVAARTLGLPSVVFEPNATAGLANRLLARIADRVLLGVAGAAADFPTACCRTTGIPVRRALYDAAATRDPTWTTASGRPFRILVMGGSQGSAFLNARVPGVMRALRDRGLPLSVQHQTGTTDVALVRAAYAEAEMSADVAVFVDDVRRAYERADFAITCGGAGTLAELAAVGVPALVVPFARAARNHQVANVEAFAAVTGAWWTRERAWDDAAVVGRLAELASDPSALGAASARMRSAATPAAATTFVDACADLVSRA